MSAGRIVIRESAHGRALHVASKEVEVGETVTVGRAGGLGLGRTVRDRGISTTALIVTVEEAGWAVLNSNRNGVLLRPWGRPESRARSHLAVQLPLVALRVLGVEEANRHFVLLEHDLACWPAPMKPSQVPVDTREASVPPPLTAVELRTLRTVFASVLEWPPERDEARQLREAARVLRIGHRAVRGRLETVKRKAEALGMTGVTGVTDPRLAFFLVSAGYVPPPVLGRPPTGAEPAS